ncbi:hypothetical protein B0H16DRAFT_1711010 [Mycena metata]|uniref:F-box domain-containing protein n=1 Tax=Mycena metata TaxID=1033252 RepID=A0AAD7NY56_9AGAR|nr:hypothetical protein B0H16DRAFT_1711010 [Mycena metata]
MSSTFTNLATEILTEIFLLCLPINTLQAHKVGRWTDTFLELPDDVLLVIFQHLGSELYALARLSPRLNLLALPVYLAHNGVPNPTELCEFRLVNRPMGGDTLSALSSAVYITQTKHISCEFTSGGNVSCYLHHIERLTNLIRKLSSVDAILLSLVDLGNVDSEVNELVKEQWRRTFSALLNVILERMCASLTIRVSSAALLEVLAEELPTLAELEVVSCPDFLDLKLIELLGKLPALTRLSLPFKADLHGDRPFASDRIIPSLPNVCSLTTAAPFLLHFLLADNALPILENLELECPLQRHCPRNGR